MNQLEMKKLAAQAALQYVKADTIVGGWEVAPQ